MLLKVWAKRHRDLSRARNQVVCRLHAVLCLLIPGGVSKRITAGQAARILEAAEPRGAAGAARWVLAEQFLADLRRIDTRRRDVQKKLTVAVRASAPRSRRSSGWARRSLPRCSAMPGTSPGSPARTTSPPITAPRRSRCLSGGRVSCRLSLRGNRRMNHAVHMAAVTQIRYRHSKGRVYYEKKMAEGETSKEALRALKRQVSDALYQKMKADARRAAAAAGPGGTRGTAPKPAWPACTPQTGSSAKPLPHPARPITPGQKLQPTDQPHRPAFSCLTPPWHPEPSRRSTAAFLQLNGGFQRSNIAVGIP
jgi:transposase